MNNYYALSNNRQCLKYKTNYQLTYYEFKEDKLCHSNQVELAYLQKWVEYLEKSLRDSVILK